MRLIERSGVHVDQCPECRGIFLDRGELDRLLDLESASLGRGPMAPAAAPAGRPSAAPPTRDDMVDEDEPYDTSRRGRRRGGFLSELFEGFGD
jgi:hypothetical protein